MSRELALLRLVAQRVVGPAPASPHGIVERLLCLQGQDYWSGTASVALRSGKGSSGVAAALDAGTVVRAWPLRGTLHLVTSADLGWLRALLAPRALAAAAAREARLGITDRVLATAERVTREVLSSRGPSARSEITAAWRARGLDTGGERGYQLMWHLGHAGTVCYGPVRNGQQLLVLADDWIPPATGPTGDAALETLARRYFEGRGPATAADLARWANLTVADATRAVALARGHLDTLTVDDAEYLLGPATRDELADCRSAARGVLVLPGFDELLMGYRDRSPTLPDDLFADVFANRNGIPSCVVVVDGRVAATWKRPLKHAAGPIEITPLVALSRQAIRTAARNVSALR